jgi:hypothetical protein
MDKPIKRTKARNETEPRLTKAYLLDWFMIYSLDPEVDPNLNVIGFVLDNFHDDYLEMRINLLEKEPKETLISLILLGIEDRRRAVQFFKELYLKQMAKKQLAAIVLMMENSSGRIQRFMERLGEEENLSMRNIFLEGISQMSFQQLRQAAVLFLYLDGKLGGSSDYYQRNEDSGKGESLENRSLPKVSDKMLLRMLQSP